MAPVEAISIQGVGHSLPMSGMAAMAIAFFGLNTQNPPPTTTTTTTTQTGPPPTSSCKVTYTVLNAWNTGLTTDITIANTGSTPINSWSLGFTLPAGQAITSGWNATFTPTAGQITARNMSYNSAIAPGGSVGSIGFQASHNGNTGKPTAFTLNSTPCTLG
jgi:cellulase/cellobiase CelA1